MGVRVAVKSAFDIGFVLTGFADQVLTNFMAVVNRNNEFDFDNLSALTFDLKFGGHVLSIAELWGFVKRW